MKVYILFAILISLGVSQIIASSQTICGCTQLTNQHDCNTLPGCTWSQNTQQCSVASCASLTTNKSCLEASYYCQWNSSVDGGTCQTFSGCENLTANSSTECASQNARCLGFDPTNNLCEELNQITSQCSDYPNTSCTYNVGSDGVCFYNTAALSCNPVSQCSQVQTQKYCQFLNQANGVACFWNQDLATPACQQITSCAQFNTQDSCKYYLTSLNSIQLTLCSWNGTTCVAANNASSLNADNCLTNTAYSYRWFGTASNSGICATCQPITVPTVTLYSRSQCQCSQYIYQKDCTSQNGLCQWNTRSSTCSQNTCANIKSQNVCVTVSNCYWNYANGGVCSNLTSCANLTYKQNGVGCAAQSLYCAGFSNGTCSNTSELGTCQSQTTLNGCQQYVGSNGVCRWINNTCVPLTSCGQITDALYCRGQQNLCFWNAQAQTCQQLTCSQLTQQNCAYVITSFQESQYQLCRYNLSQGACENAYSALLQSSTTCATNTGNTFRWSTNNASSGMCVSCGNNQLQLQTPSSCQCSQLHSQANCENTGFCTFNAQTKVCQASPCQNYNNQITCATLSTCYWGQNGCQNFTSCSQLPMAKNQLECINMNASCKGITNGVCQSNATQTCTAIYTATENCYNNIGTDGICFLSTTGQTTQCVGFSSCAQASNASGQALCLRNQFSCTWTSRTNTCSQVSCASFSTQINCKFYLPNPLSSEVIPCMWNSINNTCVTASNILSKLTQTTCASNTHNTYSWVTISADKGYCVKCQEQITAPNQCTCAYLSQTDCSQALECSWSNGQCQQLACGQILQQTVCALQIGCQWNNNQCNQFNGQCSTLLGSTQAQCLAQNVYCVGSNGTSCSNIYNTCASNTTDTACVASLGSDGACYWNQTTTKCVAVNSCTQLPQSGCQLRSKSCYWNGTSCQTLTCSTLYSQFGQCTYIVGLTTLKNVQSCIFSNNACVSTQDPLNFTQEQCYTNSNKTARWVPTKNGESGVCYSCSVNTKTTYTSQQCQCYQYMTQGECTEASQCVWSNGLCIQTTCSSIYIGSICASTLGCAWTASTKTCGAFTACNSVAGTTLTIQNCLSYSSQCRGYNGTNCTQTPNNACSLFTTASTCSGSPGSDGICYWNPTGLGSCVAVTTCNQITIPQICNYYPSVCQLVGTTCQQLTCANFTTPASCQYVVTSFVTGDIQQCQWIQGACQNLVSPTSLNSVNCSINTGFTYRWYPARGGSSEGYCTKCVLNPLYIPGQCACNQLIYKEDCLQNPQCSWSTNQNTPSCYNKPCSQIIYQSFCNTNPRCQWSEANQSCQPFSQCSDLSGVNAGECASYSIFCGAVSTTFLSVQQKYLCAATPTQQCQTYTPTGTTGQTTPTQCENTYIAYGICQYNPTTQKCTKVTTCAEVISQQKCQQLTHSCLWVVAKGEATGSCVAATCELINSQQACTYVLSSITTPSAASVTQCSWTAANGCSSVANTQNLTASNCFSNSLMMSRWTSTASTSGHCLTCSQQSSKAVVKSPCECSSLSQDECILASPQCTVNTSSKCVTQTCTNITNKNLCALNPACIYIGTSCQTYNSTNTCAGITGMQSNLDCILSSINCQYYNSTSTKCQKLECSSLNTEANCNNVDYCYWNNKDCVTIDNCKQITDVALCSLQTNRCQWSVVLNSCITQSCSSYTTQAACTFVYTSYSKYDVALCQWNSMYNDCRSVSLSYVENFNQSSTQCYSSTGHLYHLDGTTCTKCFQNLLSVLLITILLIFI